VVNSRPAFSCCPDGCFSTARKAVGTHGLCRPYGQDEDSHIGCGGHQSRGPRAIHWVALRE